MEKFNKLLYTKETCSALGHILTIGACAVLIDLSTLQRPVVHFNVSTPKGPESCT
jgi:hypothetical protein